MPQWEVIQKSSADKADTKGLGWEKNRTMPSMYEVESCCSRVKLIQLGSGRTVFSNLCKLGINLFTPNPAKYQMTAQIRCFIHWPPALVGVFSIESRVETRIPDN